MPVENAIYNIVILGFGISKTNWRKLYQTIEDRLVRDSIEFTFSYFPPKEVENETTLMNIDSIRQADIIFIGQPYLNKIKEILSELNSTESEPILFCVTNDIQKTLREDIVSNPETVFNFLEYDELIIRDSALISSEGHEIPIKVAIPSHPEILEYEDKNPFLDRDQNIAFYLKDRINKLRWRGHDISVTQLITEVLNESPQTIENIKGLLFQNGSVYLSNGFHLFQIRSIQFGSISIEQVFNPRWIGAQEISFVLILRRINERLNEIICQKNRDNYSFTVAYVKNNAKTVVFSEFPVIGQIIKQIMVDDLFSHVEMTDDKARLEGRYVIQTVASAEESVYDGAFSFPIDADVFDIPGFPQVTEELVAVTKCSFSSTERPEIRRERKQLIKKIDTLDGQLKNLSSSKVLADQEKYMNLLASRKLEIISVLLELASIWDDTEEGAVRTYEEEVLVLHEDKMEASFLNKRIQGDGKRLFLNISDSFASMREFVTLNTDIYESFLQEGIIICSTSGQRLLRKKIDIFTRALEDKKYPDVASGLEKLKTLKSGHQDRLVELACAEAILVLKDIYELRKDQLITDLIEAAKEQERETFQIGRFKEICFLGTSENRVSALKEAFTQMYSLEGGTRLHTICEQLDIKKRPTGLEDPEENEMTSSEDPSEKNSPSFVQYSDFLKKTLKQLREIKPDLLVIEHNIHVLQSLMRVLRQTDSTFRFIPVIAFFTGDFDESALETLSLLGVKAFYVDKWHMPQLNSFQRGFLSVLGGEITDHFELISEEAIL